MRPEGQRKQQLTRFKFFNLSFKKDEQRQIYFILRIARKNDEMIFSIFYLGGKKTAEKYGYVMRLTDQNEVSAVKTEVGFSCSCDSTLFTCLLFLFVCVGA